jgi:hypothetical protein
LVDRSSAPKRVPHRTPELRVEAIVALRRLRMTRPRSPSCCRWRSRRCRRCCAGSGLASSALDPPEPANRYQHAGPGGLCTSTSRNWAGSSVLAIASSAPAAARRRSARSGECATAFLGRAVAWFQSMGVKPERCSQTTAPATARESTPPPAANSACATASPAPTGPGRTESRTLHQDAHRPLGPRRDLRDLERTHQRATRLAEPTTTSPADPAPSATNHPQLASNKLNNLAGNYS